MSKSKLNKNQLLGVILLVALAVPFIPIISALSSIGTIAIFLVAIYLIVKGM